MVLETFCVEPIYPQYSGVLETCLALRYWFFEVLGSVSVKSDESPDFMVEHFILANFVDSYGTRLRETGCFSITKVKRFGKKSLDIMVVF